MRAVSVGEVEVRGLVDALTAELAESQYTPEQTFGYTPEMLAASAVHLVGAYVDGALAGIGGVEVDGDTAELKRFFVLPAHRGTGVADAVLAHLIDHAASCGARALLLETGDRQLAAQAFYRRNGFAPIDRFGPYVDSATSVCMRRVIA